MFFIIPFSILLFFRTFAPAYKARALSSAGLEHLPYKQRVGGSNPSAPTRATEDVNHFASSVFYSPRILHVKHKSVVLQTADNMN